MICNTLHVTLFIGCLFITGGKAYGLLKSQQEEKLNSINEVS